MTKRMPSSAVRVVPDSLTLPASCFSTSAIFLLKPTDLADVVADQVRAHRAITAQQRQRCGLVLLRGELGDLLLVARVGDHEIYVRAVDHPGAGANELVTVVRQQLEVDEDISALRRGQAFTSGNDARYGDGVRGIGLALGGVALALTMGEERGHLVNLFADIDQMPGEPGTVAPRAFDADGPFVTVRFAPLKQRVVSTCIVWELPDTHHASQLVERRRGKRALVGVDTDRHTHPGLLLSADLRCDQREDNQALGGTPLYRVTSASPVPAGGTVRSQVSAGAATTRAFGVTSGRLPETLRETEIPQPDSHARTFVSATVQDFGEDLCGDFEPTSLENTCPVAL